ncbi:aminotransferase class III-fold pyridoxal phosphate-dependent enzyme [Leptospira kanakyensis]|uniref:aminotransferase class III-fold pyridoxal phosphate-dependent enzyme n=1 Tax=Leptospira kanakyensis TaxID=2484968 RepID=UPI00223E41F7|nr:aminotransferase class III-fold pyridoxal phosphate-dependent enzyme [Leptospira kanakyensis]MCW7482146.1 aminotransferase class III-fold pyridoxal phosphate-dependent enzyme [Leptospira kanakyensis]
MKIVAIIQARMGSTRFPNKVMKEIAGKPMIGLLLDRLSKSKKINEILIATSTDSKNFPLAEYVHGLGFGVFKGSENNVLERYYLAAKESSADVVIRITGDCPLIDSELVDKVVDVFLSAKVDYCANFGSIYYPDGLDTEVFSFHALEKANEEAKEDREKEHVTPYIRENSQFMKTVVLPDQDYSGYRWTVDEKEDFEVIEKVFNYFAPKIDFSWEDVLNLQMKKPEIFSANQHLIRNEGASMGTGQKLWKRAKRIIPGGNMLLSKRAELFLPEKWPAYFSKSKGCRVWDLDDREYLDMCFMGVGTNTLGYGNTEVDNSVLDTIRNGNMSTLNCPEEVYLAEKLVEIHPWADMVRFARTGGEANAIAIRLARAASGRDNVAICGYHGWHDWYLSANLTEENSLSAHVLSGLSTIGVPKNLKQTVFPFEYNNIAEFEDIIEQKNIGTIMMEVSRNYGPANGFLETIRKVATEKNIVLIFDECTSGFRQTFGGIHKDFKIEPDLAVFGKAMGNGYAITALIGKRSIMEYAQKTFISSTFWTERIGSAAALKTLEIMEREQSWKKISSIGNRIGKRWLSLGEKYGLGLEVQGLDAIKSFKFTNINNNKAKTFITQEMLKRGILATNLIYTCIEHSDEVIDIYFNELEPVFQKLSDCEKGKSIDELLDGDECHSGFQRLN